MNERLNEGEKHFTEGRLAEARACFEAVLDDDPVNGQALNNLGVLAFEEKEGNRAAGYFLKSIEADPSYTDPVANLCALMRASGNLSEARPILESLAAKYPENIEVERLLTEAGGTPLRLTGKRLAIINALGNKFDNIYKDYFLQNNDVRVFYPSSEQDLREACAWADVLWSTWCNEPTVLLSQMNPAAPLVTHIRSYEILTEPLMQNTLWGNISGAIFVADHIREIAAEMWPHQLAKVNQTTVHNMVHLPDYPCYDKTAGKNICYIGYLNHKKGIPLLLQIIREAADIDPAYRLHVAGTFQEKRFEVYWQHLVARMDLEDNIVMHGWVKDVPALLDQMDYVISTSPWEGCPNNIIEAMACGVKPLVHNWRGADDLFPGDLVFSSIPECLSILTDMNYNSKAYRSYVETSFNADRNMRKIDAFLAMVATGSLSRGTDTSAVPDDLRTSDQEQARGKTGEETAQGLNFYQPLPKSVEVVDNRKAFTIDFCRGKRVLHVGCVDAGMMESRIKERGFLHYGIAEAAERVIGVDIDADGLARLSREGFEVYNLDLQTDQELLMRLSRDVNVIVIPEVIEHLNNVGRALENIKACQFAGEILITTPNAFSYRAQRVLSGGTELVHPDHNYYFSPTTLKTLIDKHGLKISRMLLYYWPIADEIGREMEQTLRSSPYFAEGLIAVVQDPEARASDSRATD